MHHQTSLTLTVEETARRLGISRGYAYELARTGRLPGVVRLGRVYRVSAPALNRALGIVDFVAGPDEG